MLAITVSHILSRCHSLRQWKAVLPLLHQTRALQTIATAQHASSSELDVAIQDLQMFINLKEARLQALRKLAIQMKDDPLPPARIVDENAQTVPPEARAGPIPIDVFRERLAQCTMGRTIQVRRILVQQLLRCTVPYDLLKILVITITHPFAGVQLALLHPQVFRAMYRCRQNVSDRLVLRTLLQYIGRFEMVPKISIPIGYYKLALKFAARCRDPMLMRRCLLKYKEQTTYMTSDLFRAVIAKCSIGHRKLGAKRNGHWKTADLRQVLLGFDCERHLPRDQQTHLQQFYDRSRWEYIHGWISALALAHAYDEVWTEWRYWLTSSIRLRATLTGPHETDVAQRGDMLFLSQLALADNLPMLWQMLRESGRRINEMKSWILLEFVRGASLAGDLSEALTNALIERYGERTLPSGDHVSDLCVLDNIDSQGNAIMSAQHAQTIYNHLIREWRETVSRTRGRPHN